MSGNYRLFKNKFIKGYFWVLFFYLIFLILFSIDIILNLNFTKYFFKNLIILFSYLNFYIFENELTINIFVDDFYERLNFLINYEFILIQVSSLVLLIIVYFNFTFNKKYYFNLFFLITILFNNYISASYFTPLEKNNFNLWSEIEEEKVIKDSDRLISLSQNYLFNMKPQEINIKKLNEENLKVWIQRNPINQREKYYGIMSPPFLSV